MLEEGFNVLGLAPAATFQREAEGFYAVHRERPFFKDLCEFMTSGPVVVVALERENAVAHWRKVIGATDPAKADAGTIRKLYGASLGENAVHGSDSVENGRIECAYYFSGLRARLSQPRAPVRRSNLPRKSRRASVPVRARLGRGW